jgi:hypothetical protein
MQRGECKADDDPAVGFWLHKWLWPYLVAETCAVAVALASIHAASSLTDNNVILVAASVGGSSAGYYGVVLTHALTQEVTEGAANLRVAFVCSARTLLVDYGSVEALDALLFSPFLLFVFFHLLPNRQAAVVASEVVGTLVFYLTLHGIRIARSAWTVGRNTR